MSNGFRLASLLALSVAVAAQSGCGRGNGTPAATGGSGPDSAHEHGEEGPHGGHLMELGRDHKYHAELVDDDESKTVTIFILDADMKEFAIDQPSVALSLTSDGTSSTFDLPAVRSNGATGSSRFESSDKAVFQMLEQHGDISGKLRVTIGGTPYVGTLDHHDHDDDHSTHNH